MLHGGTSNVEVVFKTQGTNDDEGIIHVYIGTMQNRFPNLDNFFVCLAYDDLMTFISKMG